MGMIVDTSVGPAIFIVVGLYWNTSRVLLLAVTSALYGLKVALIFSNIARQTESMKVEMILTDSRFHSFHKLYKNMADGK